GWSGTNASPAPVTKKDEPVETSKAHRIPLSTFDIKDHNEAPDLAADAQGRVYLAWSSQTGADERAVFLSRTDANSEKFGEPTTVSRSGIVKTVSQMKGKTITRESKMLPHLAIHNENIHLNWVEALPGNQSVRMKVATSTDAGDHFGPAKVVFNGDKTRPTFTAMTVGADGTIACTWLDNRERAQQPVVAVRNPGDAVFEPALSLHPGQDGRGTCPCCPTATAPMPTECFILSGKRAWGPSQSMRAVSISTVRSKSAAAAGGRSCTHACGIAAAN
ncbi:MAG: hypothetical protein K8T89_18905, partial [Planctomycetes bacterium]|nr:hypothetical protein [Planctomycetota bacterium]